MAYDGEVIIKIDGDDSDFQGKLSGLEKAGKVALGAVAAAATAAGAALAGMGAYVVKTGADFEAGMSEVKAISRASAEEMEALTEKAKVMGAQTKFSASESADAFKFMAQAGWNAQAMIDGISGVMDLAAASGEDLALTSSIVTDTLTAFGMAAGESGRLADVLAMAANASNTGVAEMGYTFKYVAPVAGALGYNIEDVSVAIGLMANSGIKAETAGTALRATLTNLAKPSDDVAMYMERLGVSLTDSSGRVKPFNSLMEQLRSSFSKLTDAQKAEYAAGLAGKEAMSGLLAIVNASDADYKSLASSINNASGAAQEAADIMQDNLLGAFEELGGGVETVGLQIYEGIQDPLKKAVQSASAGIDELSQSLSSGKLSRSLETMGEGIGELVDSGAELATKAIPKLINGFAYLVDHGEQVAGAVKGAAIALGTFKAASMLDKAAKSWQAASAAVEAFTIAQKAAATAQAASTASLTIGQSAVGVLSGKLGVAATAQGLLSSAMAAAPFATVAVGALALGGAVAAVAAASADGRKEMEEYEARIEETDAKVQEMRESQERLSEAQAENVSSVNSQVGAVQGYVSELKTYLDADGKVIEGHELRAQYLADEINRLIPDAIAKRQEEGDTYLSIKDNIDQLILAKQKEMILDSMREDVADALKNRSDAYVTLIQKQQELGAAQAGLAEQTARYNEVMDAQVEIGKNGFAVLSNGTHLYEGNWESTLNTIISKQEEWQQKVDEGNAKVGEAQAVFDNFNKTIETNNAINAAADFDELSVAIAGLSGKVVQSTGENEEALAKAVATLQIAYDSMVAKTAESWDGMTAEQQQAQIAQLRELKAKLDEQVKVASDAGFNISKATGEGAARGSYEYTGKIKELLDAGYKELETAGTKTIGSGESFGKGFNEGIVKSAGEIMRTVTGVGTDSTNALNAAIDVNSPSRKTRESGRSFSEGLALGITDGQSGVINASVKVAQAAVRAAKQELDIHSPSKKMREQVGRQLSLGMALGIEDGIPAVRGAVTLLSQVAFESAKEDASSYKELGTLYMNNLSYGIEAGRDVAITRMEKWVEDDYNALAKKLDAETDALVKAKQAQMKKVGDTQKEALQKEIDQIKQDTAEKKKAHKDAGSEVTSAYKTALTTGYSEALDEVKAKMTAITEEAQRQRDAVLRDQQAMTDKLTGFGDLFTIDSDSGMLSLGNLENNIKAVERYDKALTALSERGVSDEFMSKVTALGVEEGTKFAEKLANLPADAFERYMDAWQKQQDLAKEVAEKFYADQLQTIDDEFSSKIEGALADVPNILDGVGKDSIQGMINGMYSKSGALSEAASSIVSQAIAAMRMAADIHSPSRKTRDLVGAPLAEGIAVGFDQQMASVYRQVSQTLDGEIVKMSADVKVQAERQAAQSSPAPVQTVFRNEIIEKQPVIQFNGSLSALGRVLEPYIRVETKRRGGNLVKGEI